MAQGSIYIFNEAKAKMLDGDWASTDHIYFALIQVASTPTVTQTTPTWSDFSANEAAAGNYTTNGIDLGTIATCVSQTGGVMTFDSATNIAIALHASHDTDVRWGIFYNFTDAAQDALGYLDLGAEIDMTAVPLNITWPNGGIFTIT